MTGQAGEGQDRMGATEVPAGRERVHPWIATLPAENLELAVATFWDSQAEFISWIRSGVELQTGDRQATAGTVGGDPHYGLWLLQADFVMRRGTNLELSSFTDFDWLRAYDQDWMPARAAEQALTNSRFGFLLEPMQEARRQEAARLDAADARSAADKAADKADPSLRETPTDVLSDEPRRPSRHTGHDPRRGLGDGLGERGDGLDYGGDGRPGRGAGERGMGL